MKIKDTSFEWAENGVINNLDETAQKLGYIPNTQANADDVNFKLNNLDDFSNDTNNELINLLNTAGITPDENDNTQISQAVLAIGSAYLKGYILGGVLNSNVLNPSDTIDISELNARSLDNATNIDLNAQSLTITTSSDWKTGTVPSLISTTVYVWADNVDNRFYFDDSTGSNITTAKVLVGYFDTTSLSQIDTETIISAQNLCKIIKQGKSGNNRYRIFNNGLIEQWGSDSIRTGSAGTSFNTINYPIPFNILHSCVVTMVSNNGGANGYFHLVYANTTSAQTKNQSTSGNLGNTTTVQWYARGE